MDIDVNVDIIKERFAFFSRIGSRELSIDSKASSIAYHKRIEIMNNLLNEDIREPVNNL